jgi:hypothetical protein
LGRRMSSAIRYLICDGLMDICTVAWALFRVSFTVHEGTLGELSGFRVAFVVSELCVLVLDMRTWLHGASVARGMAPIERKTGVMTAVSRH